MSTEVVAEEAELENVLQQIFMECDASTSTSTPDSTASIGDDVPVIRIIEYVQEQLPAWSIDNLMELWKCLGAVSTNDRVNLRQFKEATKCWITKMQQMSQSLQDGNNNAQEKLFIMSDADTSMKAMGADRDVVEFELRVKLRELHEENILLRDDLERHEASISNLRQQSSIAEKQLDRYVQKCQQLEKENDEQREQLNEAIKNEKTMSLTLQRSMKEQQNLLNQLEAAEIEIQAIPPLRDKMEKIGREKTDCLRQIARLQEEFDERENECNELKATMDELENTSANMRETYEHTIRNLRERNRQLTDENTELQSLSALSGCRSAERLSMSPDAEGCMHSTPYKSERVPLQDSLYAELKASGFAAERSRNEPRIRELEEELDEYDVAISATLEQIEKVVQIFVTMRSSCDVPQLSEDMNTRAYNVEALKHKIAYLLKMVTEEITRRSTKDSSTQLRADSASAIEDLDQFGVACFRDLLLMRARLCPKAETDLWSVATQCANENEDGRGSPDEDAFSRVVRAYSGVQNQFSIIHPIVEELHDIIESTLNTLTDQSSSSAGSRYRSIHTLPSSSQPAFSPSAKDSWRTSSYRSSRSNSPDASCARGDSLTLEGCDEKSTSLSTESYISAQENPTSLEGNQLCEMSSALQMNAKATSEEDTSGASTSASHRRKISVYCRSFDVVEDPCEDQRKSSLKVRESADPDDRPAQIDGRNDMDAAEDRSGALKYPFNQSYRTTKNESDSSCGSSPQKQSQNSLLEDELLPINQTTLRKVCLAPTRLKFPQKIKDESGGTAEDSDRVLAVTDSTESFEHILSSHILGSLSPVGSERGERDAPASTSSSTSIMNQCETEVDSTSRSPSENFPRGRSTSAHSLILHNQSDSAEIADSESPHSQTSVQRVNGERRPRVERSVDSQMSNREDSSAGSDSECEPVAATTAMTAESDDPCVGVKAANEADRAASAVSRASTIGDSAPAKVVPCENAMENNGRARSRDELSGKQRRRQRLLIARRAISESEGSDRSECRCKQNPKPQSAPLIPDSQSKIFPSLTDLQESGIANLSDTELDSRENLSEFELQKRYIAFSLCLCTDRVTLPQRVAMSLRQRDQSEKNLVGEVQKMHRAIQELAPLCTDRESVERVDRVRYQLDMVARCAHRVSCAAETLGAVHQERRVSHAILLADRYLQLLQSRCEKLAVNVAETKRILTENNIVIEENSSELGDDLPRIRYRSGTPANNRMMMARRRASVATMSRPMGSMQDVSKDTARQRNSVSGRVTLRRPSFSSESPKWEIEKLDRTDSSNSIGELRGIFEQAESRRSSKEENNNMLRLNHSNSQNILNCPIIDDEVWTNAKQEAPPVVLSINKDNNLDHRLCATLSQPLRLRSIPWRTMLGGFILFFLGFFVNQGISMMNPCGGPLNGWSIEQILSRYVQIRNAAPHPM